METDMLRLPEAFSMMHLVIDCQQHKRQFREEHAGLLRDTLVHHRNNGRHEASGYSSRHAINEESRGEVLGVSAFFLVFFWTGIIDRFDFDTSFSSTAAWNWRRLFCCGSHIRSSREVLSLALIEM